MKEKLLISACLLGVPCRYNGECKTYEGIAELGEKFELIPVCPEVLGGLPTPREPSEILGNKVFARDGRDVTSEYERGAEKTLAIARENGCARAVLKERSPSCGKGMIHNGLFDGGLVPGDGVTVRLLKAAGIAVYGESEIGELTDEKEI